jgi:hypothetical protein
MAIACLRANGQLACQTGLANVLVGAASSFLSKKIPSVVIVRPPILMMGADPRDICLILELEIVDEVVCCEGMVVGMIALDCYPHSLANRQSCAFRQEFHRWPVRSDS